MQAIAGPGQDFHDPREWKCYLRWMDRYAATELDAEALVTALDYAGELGFELGRRVGLNELAERTGLTRLS